MKKRTLWLIGAGAVGWYLYNQQQQAAAKVAAAAAASAAAANAANTPPATMQGWGES